jgi:ABC-type iron transport system FetAB permease component
MFEHLQVVMACLHVWLAFLCCLIACFVTSVGYYCHWLQSKVTYWFIFMKITISTVGNHVDKCHVVLF